MMFQMPISLRSIAILIAMFTATLAPDQATAQSYRFCQALDSLLNRTLVVRRAVECSSGCAATFVEVGCQVCAPEDVTSRTSCIGEKNLPRAFPGATGTAVWFKSQEDSTPDEEEWVSNFLIEYPERIEEWKALDLAAQVKAEESVQRSRRAAADAAADRNRLALQRLPTELRSLDSDDFCVTFGAALREETLGSHAVPAGGKLSVLSEAKRRGLKLDGARVVAGLIRMGITKCELFAAWGPAKEARLTVGRWGVHIQYRYGMNTFVYVENGRVASWQQ